MHAGQRRKHKLVIEKILALTFLGMYLLLPFGKTIGDALHRVSHAVSEAKGDHPNNQGHDHFFNHGTEFIPRLDGSIDKNHQHVMINWLLAVIDSEDNSQEFHNQNTPVQKFDKYFANALKLCDKSTERFWPTAFDFLDILPQLFSSIVSPPPDFLS